MLSGEITGMQAKEAVVDALLDGLEEEVKFLLQRNLRLLRDQRGSEALTYEQKQLVEYVVQHPEGLLKDIFESLKFSTPMLAEYVENADLTPRGW